MTPTQFISSLKKSEAEVRRYATSRFPSVAGDTALRFINGNFRAQGYQGQRFKKWKPSKGTILVDSGALRAANYYVSRPGMIILRNHQPYAGVHNKGFRGTVSIPAHSRNRYASTRVGTGRFTKTGRERTRTMTVKSGESSVKAHTRKMNIPQRQFMPILPGDTPVLNRAIKREVTRDLKQLLP